LPTIEQYNEYYTQGLVFEYQSSTDSYKIAYYNGTDAEVIVPSFYNWKPVKNIGTQAFYNCAVLTRITIPSTVKYIESYAFYNCNNLRGIYFGGTQAQWNAISKSESGIGSSVTVYYAGN
jgi:hypothetical protein